jgi:hypothetical protein
MKKINLKQNESSRCCFVSLLFAVLVLIILPFSGFAQDPPTSIDGVYIERAPQPDKKGTNVTKVEPLQITETKIIDGDVIVFDIPGLNGYLSAKNKPLRDVLLKINQIELSEFPVYIESTESDIFRFRFQKQYLRYEDRVALYKLPGKSVKEIQLGIKIDENNVLYFNEPAQLYFKRIEYGRAFGWILVAAFVLFFALLIIKWKAFITDNVAGLSKGDPKNTCYSFSKTQLAFWTFIILSSFIYIWAITGDLNSINTTGLILLGITSATITASNLISKNAETQALAVDESAPVQNNVGSDDKSTTENSGTPTSKKVDKLVKFRTHKPGDTFLTEILSDEDGISIHRLQALVFNLVFGIAFIISVLWNYTMPEFSETQLILLGLSSGTYAFNKINENK